MPSELTKQYDEVDRAYTEALCAIRESQRPAEERLDLLHRLEDGHINAGTPAAQLAAIRAVIKKLRG